MGTKALFKTCFVITPYGTKTEANDAGQTEKKSYNFEYVFDVIISKALDGVVDVTHRSKDKMLSGIIQEDMFRDIISADVVICDITMLNPNVMYELGIRHAARPSGTIIIRQDRRELPFNISYAKVVQYMPPPEPGAAAESDEQKVKRETELEETRELLRKYVRQSLTSRRIDSPVHALIPNLNVVAPPRRLNTIATGVFDLDPEVSQKIAADRRNVPSMAGKTEKDQFTLGKSLESVAAAASDASPASPSGISSLAAARGSSPRAEIGIATGNLRDIYDAADVWVNPENTRMEMGPLFGETVSSYIRVLGAKSLDKAAFGADKIQLALRASMKNNSHVLPGTAITTQSGALKETHGVRQIVHVAAQEGFPLGGFATVKDVESCVERALEEIERLNRQLVRRLGLVAPLRRVLIPLFGTRNPGRRAAEVATDIVRAVKRHLDLEPDTTIRRVLFLATTDQDLELCETAFENLGYAAEAIEWQVHSFGGR